MAAHLTQGDGAQDLREAMVDSLCQYLLLHQRDALDKAVRGDVNTGLVYPLPIHLTTLADLAPAFANSILLDPKKTQGLVDRAMNKAQQIYMAQLQQSPLAPTLPELTFKETIPRFYGLPAYLGPNPELSPTVSQLRARHIGKLLTLSGTVVKSGPVQSLAYKSDFECTKCRGVATALVDHGAGGRFILPATCSHRGPRGGECGGTNFRETANKLHTDYQEIKIQERQEAVGIANTPRSFTVILEHELVDKVRPGEDIEVTGVMIRRWRGNLLPTVKCAVESVMQASHVTALNTSKRPSSRLDPETEDAIHEFWQAHADCPLKGRNKILSGICPQIFGLFHVKLATALSLVGGVPVKAPDGRSLRGEIHMLIVGDPGTGKSQFMRFASRLSARSVVTSGKGSSNAGLTVTAVKENNSWSLEAGALVLADGGMCCIDEFSGIKEADRASIHEAMEQQTVSVAKAGLMTTLSTRTAVFAVCNPKGRGFNPGASLEANTGIGGPLLSRFDLIVTLRDRRDPAWDDRLATHILQAHLDKTKNDDAAPASTAAAQDAAAALQRTQSGGAASTSGSGSAGWTLGVLQKYFAWVRPRETFTTPESEAVVSAYYLACRVGAKEQSRVTPRLLESVTRLSQAHAKLMNRQRVTRQDAVIAVALVELSSAYITGSIFYDLHLDETFQFSEDPDRDYVAIEEKVMRVLRQTPGTQHLNLGGALLLTAGPDEDCDTDGEGEGRGGGAPELEPETFESEAVRVWRAQGQGQELQRRHVKAAHENGGYKPPPRGQLPPHVQLPGAHLGMDRSSDRDREAQEGIHELEERNESEWEGPDDGELII